MRYTPQHEGEKYIYIYSSTNHLVSINNKIYWLDPHLTLLSKSIYRLVQNKTSLDETPQYKSINTKDELYNHTRFGNDGESLFQR